MAIASDIASTPVGRRPSSQARRIAAMPPSMLAGPDDDRARPAGRSARSRVREGAPVARRGGGAVTPSATPQLGAVAGGSTPMTRKSVWPRPRRCSAAARAPPSSSTSMPGWSGRALESTITSGRPAARICSTSGWRADRPIATTPSTVARPMARRQRAVERRDEVQRVALLLGGQRHALREGPEERVREDDATAPAG